MLPADSLWAVVSFGVLCRGKNGGGCNKRERELASEGHPKTNRCPLEMTKMRIEAEKDIAKMTPPPQIIVRMPPVPSK